MGYKITTLVENLVYSNGLQGEHGLSLYVEAPSCKLLFDTGASPLFARNAEKLGIDLAAVDYLVLSHGHNDHTGGLQEFLRINRKARVFCRPEARAPKFKKGRNKSMPAIEESQLSRFDWITETTELAEGITLLTGVPVKDRHDTHFDHFFTVKEGEIVVDTFEDEITLLLSGRKGFSVLSACSHRGITNILRSALQIYPEIPVHTVIGGFHMHHDREEEFCVVSGYLGRHLPKRLGVCHCAGINKYALFYQQFNDRVFYNHTGRVETIE